MRGWLFSYLRSRVLPGDFHPITAYLFLEYKCNIDCWYCWSYNNTVRGMTEGIARRSIDWLHDRGCRVVGLMGGEPLLRPAFAHKVVAYAAGKGFWVYIDQDQNGSLHFAEWDCRAGQNNVIIRTDGTVAPCFPMYDATFDWGHIDEPKFDPRQLTMLKQSCQRHCFSIGRPGRASC
jgi:MoaA/NifB/PqqE/SkfB family radical SAM enzyme